MDIKKFAKLIDGQEYPAEKLEREFATLAAELGYVIIYGLSDDLLEFSGAYSEELGAWNGLDLGFVNAVWSPDEPEVSWLIKTELPHEPFTIIEDGEVYCIGAVVYGFDLPQIEEQDK